MAAAVAAALLAYPLYVQFFGPGAYEGLPRLIRGYSSDLASFVAYSRESLAGSPRTSEGLAKNPTEENSFFGWALVILVLALVWWLRRNLVVVSLAVLGLLFAVLSLGREVIFDGRETGVPSLWAPLEDLPILHSVVPTRWALAITPIIGLLLALGVERIRRLAGAPGGTTTDPLRHRDRARHGPGAHPADPAAGDPPQPRARIRDVRGLAAVRGRRAERRDPAPSGHQLHRAAALGGGHRAGHAPGRGYFLGPDTRPHAEEHGAALFTAPPRPTSSFFSVVRRAGAVPPITPQSRVNRSTTCGTGGPVW